MHDIRKELNICGCGCDALFEVISSWQGEFERQRKEQMVKAKEAVGENGLFILHATNHNTNFERK